MKIIQWRNDEDTNNRGLQPKILINACVCGCKSQLLPYIRCDIRRRRQCFDVLPLYLFQVFIFIFVDNVVVVVGGGGGGIATFY